MAPSAEPATLGRIASAPRGALLSLERFVPPHRYSQDEVVPWVRSWLGGAQGAERLLRIYGSAGVARRGSVVPIEEVFAESDFESRNERYIEIARRAGAELAQRTLAAGGLSPAELGAIVSVSCTGFMIPAVDAYVAEALGLGPRLVRLPITESGCAGGVVGLARALDYLSAHPEGSALVLALELSSLTFLRSDRSATNVVSTAIFGDGGAAALLVGPRHPRAASARARLIDTESLFFPATTHLMGFRLRNQGLQIVLDRGLAPFVRRHVADAVRGVLEPRGLSSAEISEWILHPGGRKVIEAMAEALGLSGTQLAATEAVLAEHGNMSSVTVLFVLDEVLRRPRGSGSRLALLGAFGPGFGAEFLLLELAAA